MIIKDYTDYNMWANERLIKMIKKLSHDQFNQEICSSYPSIKETLHHIIAVEIIWQQRLVGISLLEFPLISDSQKEALDALRKSSSDLKETVQELTHEQWNEQVHFKDTKGISYRFTREEIMQHCINHSTYHRGQLMTMLRQVNAINVEGLDYITYLWLKSKPESI